MITADQLKDIQDRADALYRYLDIEKKKVEFEEEDLRTQAPDFWDDPERAQEQMKLVFNRLYNADTAHVRWYFVLEDCSSLKYNNTKYLKRYGIETPYMYYLRDDDPRFCTGTDDRFLNIAQYVFDSQFELEDVIDGVPCMFVVNPQGKLKLEYRQYSNKVVVANYESLYELLYKDVYPELVPQEKPLRVQDLDFDHRDTADWTSFGNYDRKPRVCTPDGKCY